MKKVCQKANVLLSLEKDDERNRTGMQLKIWSFNNGTTILIRLFQHNKEVIKNLWDGKRNNREVNKFMLEFIKSLGLIKNIDFWDINLDHKNLKDQDEFEDKRDCIYFSWKVKSDLLKF